jgi:hypothetical protein
MDQVQTRNVSKEITLLLEASLWWGALGFCLVLSRIPGLAIGYKIVLYSAIIALATYIAIKTPGKIEELYKRK